MSTPLTSGMSRTPLTSDQYSDLTCTLEMMRAAYANGYFKQPQQALRDMWQQQLITPFAFVYLVQWFGIVGQDSAHIPHMVAELCRERT